jgi:hypothetical protein
MSLLHDGAEDPKVPNIMDTGQRFEGNPTSTGTTDCARTHVWAGGER